MNKKEYRQFVADKFVEALKKDGLEWKRGYNADIFRNQNGRTGRCYTGSNQFLLSVVSMVEKYKDPRWFTFNQIADRKGEFHKGEEWHLKKGVKAVPVAYWMVRDKVANKFITFKEADALIKAKRREPEDLYPTFKTYNVFNADEIEGIEPYKLPDKIKNNQIEINDVVETISKNMGVEILVDNSNTPCYSPLKDVVYTPDTRTFDNQYEYNSAILHELSHATGHTSRLNRKGVGSGGGMKTKADYAYEELVAEISSTFMAQYIVEGQLSDSRMTSHEAYVNSWIEVLEKKPEILTNAIKEANSAANYLELKGELISQKEYDKTISGEKKIVDMNKNKDKEPVKPKEKTEEREERSQTDRAKSRAVGASLAGSVKGNNMQRMDVRGL